MVEEPTRPCRDLGGSTRREVSEVQERQPNHDGSGRFVPGNQAGYRPPIERFHAKVLPASSGCWLWTGATDHGGYGTFQLQRGRWQAPHRFSYEHFIGAIPAAMELDHLCRMPRCVNPTHLEVVTHRVNVNRGNARRVSDELASIILAERPPGLRRAPVGQGCGEVARRYGVGASTVLRIWHGKVGYVAA